MKDPIELQIQEQLLLNENLVNGQKVLWSVDIDSGILNAKKAAIVTYKALYVDHPDGKIEGSLKITVDGMDHTLVQKDFDSFDAYRTEFSALMSKYISKGPEDREDNEM